MSTPTPTNALEEPTATVLDAVQGPIGSDETTAASSVEEPKNSAAWHVLLATWLGGMFDGMDSSIFAMVLFPALSELLGTKSHAIVGMHGSYVIALFMVGWATGAILFGILADYIGRARTMTITILLYALCTGLCATAHSWLDLGIYRFLVGAGIGGEMGIGAVMLSECWPNKSRVFAVGTMASSLGVGYMCTAGLNLLLGGYGWRWLFVAGIVPAFLTVYIRAKLKESSHFVNMQELKDRAKNKDASLRSEEENASLRFTFLDLLEKENFKKTVAVVSLTSTAIIAWWAVLAWIPAWINQLTGELAVQQRSIAMLFKEIGMILSGFLGGVMIMKFGYKRSIMISFLAAFICATGMFLTTKSYGVALLAWILFTGFFAHVPFVILWTYIPELFETRIRSTAFGVCFNIGRFAAAIAALGSGELIRLFGGSYALAASSIASVYLLGIFAARYMPATNGKLLDSPSESTPLSDKELSPA